MELSTLSNKSGVYVRNTAQLALWCCKIEEIILYDTRIEMQRRCSYKVPGCPEFMDQLVAFGFDYKRVNLCIFSEKSQEDSKTSTNTIPECFLDSAGEIHPFITRFA
ncbi:hypothetical protein PHYBLDRAFT_163673 [Phycomyces blakesleeanus NRRL 1555(-)]|uniref:Uncharacterized protein n=1 Tax=Phycomyces blakesleeanus (strain ATCC 8743b / DSM 1359 / FGSC 10004 / NBRC 33097 / NRRL 1555) TaxID=763407 RepID=A0A163B6Q0_PHYB8|nr:hypothetical protein PHYBLDRAFT_163673 [Phycomyces blakesleeanus NRRL 1555(-)]OAD78571.1 hypothetical protein PHYBLDRAFT_163673 [Phycomyces blakesleeanus NRRL 1555(-)]|eukprot:XP_018296611.1 hypothetical protein PHYBLDRAFT_163673 [Phycomyces blakesleeanus NRRL 1555(-)]